MFLLALAFKSDEKASYYEHYPSILVSFVRKTEHFSVKNGAFWWGNKSIKKGGRAISTSMLVEILVTARRIKIYYLSDSLP